MTTSAYDGRTFLLKMSTDAGSTYTTIGGCQTTDVTVNNSPIDITNVLSAGKQELLPDGGTQSVDISFDGVVANDAQLKLVQTQAFGRTLVNYKAVFGAAGSIFGSFAIDNFKLGGKFNNAQTFSGTLKSTGAVNMIPDP